MDRINADIIQRAAAGETQAFEQIYREYSGFVYRVARQVTSPEEAGDITQDVFLQVYRKLGDFQAQSSLKTWIYRIAINTAINHGKRQTRQQQRETPVAQPDQVAAAVFDSPKAAILNQDTLDHLLAQLSPDLRLCLTLRSIEGLTYEEIADSLQINLNTVRSRLRRARQQLMDLRSGVLSDELG